MGTKGSEPRVRPRTTEEAVVAAHAAPVCREGTEEATRTAGPRQRWVFILNSKQTNSQASGYSADRERVFQFPPFRKQ